VQEPRGFAIPDSSIPVSVKATAAKLSKMSQVEKSFTYHAPKGDQVRRYELIRAMGEHIAVNLIDLCPESRELSVALTKLDEVVMWANASIARNE
jgi:hypothetical protein